MPDKSPTLSLRCWIATAILAGFLCFTQAGVMASLLAGRAGFAAVAPVALLGALLLGDRLARRAGLAGRERWWPGVVALLVLAGALAMSAWYFDLSFDGEWYHQTAVYAIARDWNPLADPLRDFFPHLQLWVRHYAKGPWYVAAAVYQTTGHVEAGKFPAVVAGVAMGLAVFAAALDWDLKRRRAAVLALVVALNPVLLSELTTYLVDGIMIGFLVVAIAAVASVFRRPQPAAMWAAALASIVAINSKFTGLVFLCFVFAAGWLWCVARQRAWLGRYTALTGLTLGLGALVWGWNPYVTNTIHRQQPFYPVLGSKAFPSLETQGNEGIIRSETPKNYLAHNRLVRFGLATFGRPGNAPYGGVRNGTLMWPFTARYADLFFYRYHETRVAGFGPFFSGAFLLSFALGAWLLFQPGPARWAALLIVGTIAASLLISAHLWWARYGPQFWLLPIVPLGFVLALNRPRGAVFAAWSLAVLLIVNAAIVGGVRLKWETLATLTLRRQLTELSQPGTEIAISFRWFEASMPERLKAWGVRFQRRPRQEIRDGPELMSVVDRYPGAIHYRLLQAAPAAASP